MQQKVFCIIIFFNFDLDNTKTTHILIVAPMNKYRSAKLVSDELVVTEAENNQSSVNLIPSFAEGIIALKKNNTDIRIAMVLQDQSNSGITTEKSNAHVELVECLIDVVGGIHSYADSKGDTVLKEKVSYTNTTIEQMGLSHLITTANSTLDLAQSIDPVELAHYGIGASEITAFQAAITAFTNAKSHPREATIEHAGHTEKIATLQISSQKIVETLDKLSTQFKRKAPEYYAIYKASRINPGSSSHKKKTIVPPTPMPTPAK